MENKIIILTGPGGSGKSTLSNLIVKECGYLLIDGDQIDTEFFPNGGQSLPENLEKLKKAHNKILTESKRVYNNSSNVIIDYIIFGDYLNFFNIFKNEFGDNLIIRILLPDEVENVERDKKRLCWTTGPERIRVVRNEFISFKKQVGENNYINNSNQTPKETFNKHLKGIC